MKLYRVELTNWRSYSGGPHVIEFDDRGTIISGPNEDGKSTIFEATRRGLFDRARTSAGWVDRLVPYSANGALPEVTIELEHADRRLRVHKRFGTRGTTELFEQRDGAWVSIAANEEAEEQLIRTLGAQPGNRRTGSSPENWGPFQWLFMPQDERGLPAHPDSTACLGLDQAGVSPEFEAVRATIHREHDRTFTSTGRVAQQAELQQAENELASLQQTQQDLVTEIARFETLRGRFDEIQEALPRAREDAAEAKSELDSLETEVVDLASAEHQLEAAVERCKAARQAASHAREVLVERVRRSRAYEQASGTLESAGLDDVRVQVELRQARERFVWARQQATDLGNTIAALRRRFAAASQKMQIVQDNRSIADLDVRLTRAGDLDSQIREASAQASGRIPDVSTLESAERLLAESQAKRKILPELALRISIDGKPMVRVFADGSPVDGHEAIAIDTVLVEVAGGAVQVEGNTRQAQQLADIATEQERELIALLDPFQVETVAELRALREQRLRLQANLSALKGQRNTLDARSTEELQVEFKRLSADVAALHQAYVPNDDLDGITEEALKELANRLAADAAAQEDRFEQLRTERDSLLASFEALQQRAEETASALHSGKARTELAQAELDQHRDQFGSSEQCQNVNEAAQADLLAAERDERECRTRVESIEKNAAIRRQTAKLKAERLARAVCQFEVEAQQIEYTLDREAVAGTYSRLAEIERRIEGAERRLAALQRRGAAVKLLKQLMDEIRANAVNRVVAPIRDDLDALLDAVTCGRYRLAQIDEHLTPVRLEGAAQCRFDDGSEGLRELVATLIRMSVAAHLAKDQPQTLILDDPCVHVSRERTGRVVEHLNRLSSCGVQVVVLTHRPYEFAGLIGKEMPPRGPMAQVAA